MPPAAAPQGSISEDDLLAPFQHIDNVKGKGFRERMIDAFNMWLLVPEEQTRIMKSIVSKLHTSSLIIDDIEDGSQMRRGVPVAHSIFGIAATINCANYVYFLALREALILVPEGDERSFRTLIELFSNEMCNLHRGQGQDILFREKGNVPAEAEYLAMVADKTGGLFRLSVGMLQVFSDFQKDLNPLLNMMGEYFQILDDYLNLHSHRYHKSKTFCEDITEGKYSFPIIHSINTWRERCNDERLHKIIKKCTESETIKKYALTLIEETDSFAYTLAKLNSLYAGMQAEVANLGGNDKLLGLLEKLHSQTLEEKGGDFTF